MGVARLTLMGRPLSPPSGGVDRIASSCYNLGIKGSQVKRLGEQAMSEERTVCSTFHIVEHQYGNMRLENEQEIPQHLFEVTVSAPWIGEDTIHVLAASEEEASCQADCRWGISYYSMDKLALASITKTVKQMPMLARGWSGITF